MIFTLKILCKNTIELREALSLLIQERIESNSYGPIGNFGATIDYSLEEGDDIHKSSNSVVSNEKIRKMEDNYDLLLEGIEQAKKLKLSWKDVFNSDKRRHGSIYSAEVFAEEAGYSYFTWNGRVFKVNPEKSNHQGDWLIGTVEDVLGN